MSTQISLSEAIEGYELAAEARRLSSNTMTGYRNSFKKLSAFLAGDPPIATITHQDVEGFLAAQTSVSKKSILNYHTALCALWTWALKEQVAPVHVPHQVERPRPESRAIVPYTEAEVRALLAAVNHTQVYARPGKAASRHALPEADRNRAIILLLLDTGVRASELCGLQIRHLDLRNHDKSIMVRGGKGDKDRHIPISARTAQVIWKYLKSRPDARLNEPLFATDSGRKMDRNNLGNMLESAAKRAGVPGVHPHKFRHTFAINYLRNSGDIYTLQLILGHTTLDMVRNYLRLAQADTQAAHRRASPVDHWNL
jgi:integrase/recombinase XerD